MYKRICHLSLFLLPVLLGIFGKLAPVACTLQIHGEESILQPNSNRTLILSASTRNTSWTKAVTENHALWARWVAHSDYQYIEDSKFGVTELWVEDDELDSEWNCSRMFSLGSDRSECYSTEGAKQLQPHWLKIHLLRKFMMQEASASFMKYSHLLWVDDDILFTSRVNLIDALYAKMDAESHLIIALDVGHTTTDKPPDLVQHEVTNCKTMLPVQTGKAWRQVNTGFMFFRNSPESRALLRLVWKQRFSDLGFCENQTCLHEQKALNNLLWESGELLCDNGSECNAAGMRLADGDKLERGQPRLVSSVVKILEPYNYAEPALNLNTVWRLTHTWEGQLLPKDYSVDPLSWRWHWGDNMAHLSGMTASCRKEMVLWLARYVKQSVYGDAERPQDGTSGARVFEAEPTVQASPFWHPAATTACVRQARPSGGGNWVLPRRSELDLDAVLVAYTQGTLESTVDSIQLRAPPMLTLLRGNSSGACQQSVNGQRAAMYLLALLQPLYEHASGLPSFDNALLQQLTDATTSGFERYFNLVLHAVKLNGKYFVDVDQTMLTAAGSIEIPEVWCSNHFDGGITSILGNSFLTHRSMKRVPDNKPLLPCSMYASIALAAVAQNPESFSWVSPIGLSFIEYHNLALGAVLRQPEQLKNVDFFRYLSLVGAERGGEAYYDLAMEAVSIEGTTLQHIHKVAIMKEWGEDVIVCTEHDEAEFTPHLLSSSSNVLVGTQHPSTLVVGPLRHREHSTCFKHPTGNLHVWPWDVADTIHEINGEKSGHSFRQKSDLFFYLALAAVSSDGFALQYVVAEDLTSPEDYLTLAEAAVAKNGDAFAFIDPRAVGGAMSERYFELALKAVHARGEAFWDVDTAFLSDTELAVLVLKAIQNGDPASFKALSARASIGKALYTELALLALTGTGVEALIGGASHLEQEDAGSSSSQSGGRSATSLRPTVGVLEFLDAGQIVGARARYALAEAALRQDASVEVWEQVQELFQAGMRRDDYEKLRNKYIEVVN